MTEKTSLTIATAGQGDYFVTIQQRMSAGEAQEVMDALQADPEAFFMAVVEGTKAEPKAPRRGAGKAAKEADAKTEAEAEAEAKPKTSRRTAKAKAEPETEAEPEAEAEAPKPTRRRRTPAAPQKEEGITDADLVKACNDAAEVITPEVVAVVLMEDFKLEDVAGLAQEDRQKFMDALEVEVNAVPE